MEKKLGATTWCVVKGLHYMGLVAKKPVFGVSVNANFKPVSLATETSWKVEICFYTKFRYDTFQ